MTAGTVVSGVVIVVIGGVVVLPVTGVTLISVIIGTNAGLLGHNLVSVTINKKETPDVLNMVSPNKVEPV